MLSAGLDIGSLWSKAVVIDDGAVLGSGLAPTGDDNGAAAEGVLAAALAEAGASRADVSHYVVTGAGKKAVPFASEQATDVVCAARGIHRLSPETTGVVDLGAESTRALRVDGSGGVLEFGLNDKCAAGTGVFLDAIADVMGVPVREMGPLSLTTTAEVNITSMCVVYAESEVVSQVHRQTPKADILRGLHKSIATRVHSLTNRVGLGDRVMAIGGLALNVGIVTWLEELSGAPAKVPDSPQSVTALGAALIAEELAR